MNKSVNILRKFVEGQTFTAHGFEYNFLKVTELPDMIDSAEILVDCILPNPTQSYVNARFSADIQRFLIDFHNYLGISLNYSLHTLVDGEEGEYVFINFNKLEEIYTTVNKKFKNLRFNLKKGEIFCDIELSPPDYRIDNNVYKDAGEQVDFMFWVDVSNLRFNGKKVVLEPNETNSIVTQLCEILWEENQAGNQIETILYELLNPELRIDDLDYYLEPIFIPHNYEGQIVSGGYSSVSLGDFLSLKSLN